MSDAPTKPGRKGELLLSLAVAALRDPLVEGLKNDVRNALTDDPIDSVLLTVLIGSHLFYECEKGINPKVVTFNDALVFVSTSISVGYSDIFAKTEKGKLIATALQTFGPALSAQALDKPHVSSNRMDEELLATQHKMLDKLDAILTELQKNKAPLTE
jgi:voltage-gated potassium channel